ncbi:MAG: YibE/F family protein [Patescibacteria group bacterium]
MIKKVIVLTFGILFLVTGRVGAQEEDIPFRIEENLEARISRVLEEEEVEVIGQKQLYQKLELEITKGTLKGEKREVEVGNMPMALNHVYKVNDRVVLARQNDLNGEEMLTIVDFVRRDSLILLFGIFTLVTLVVAKKKGVRSIASMAITFLVIFNFILPRILKGSDPILITIIGSLGIIPITFYLAHGNGKKTSVAIGATVISLLITGVLATVFANLANLTGIASEEAGILLAIRDGGMNMKGLLMAGMLVGALGILDDITVSQAAIVEQLAAASEKLKFSELYKRAMKVGEDHIASMINTLVLVYAGASLPLLLIFINNPHPFSEIVNYEFIAEEIVKTLVGSIGLITAVPISTLMACLAIKGKG